MPKAHWAKPRVCDINELPRVRRIINTNWIFAMHHAHVKTVLAACAICFSACPYCERVVACKVQATDTRKFNLAHLCTSLERCRNRKKCHHVSNGCLLTIAPKTAWHDSSQDDEMPNTVLTLECM